MGLEAHICILQLGDLDKIIRPYISTSALYIDGGSVHTPRSPRLDMPWTMVRYTWQLCGRLAAKEMAWGGLNDLH
jgi:hypothetical protein